MHSSASIAIPRCWVWNCSGCVKPVMSQTYVSYYLMPQELSRL